MGLGSLERDQNARILERNNVKKSTSILSNLYRVDDRAIKFKQARNELVKITNDYLAQHFQDDINSREQINSIEEAEWRRHVKLKKRGLLESEKSGNYSFLK
mmetsp:Transcript_31192/g.23182  ORF Transcript_31192/g.23182 Transcript_31192/m.23182 type:complete len:102 (+) Transcript_31192:176-481(+)